MNETIKSGYKTTEFWVALASAVFGILTTTGVFTPDQASDLTAAVGKFSGAIITAISTAAYAVSRAKTKAASTPEKPADTTTK
jgi:hypothetical protein